jgi:hypothetical protein
MVLRQFPVWEVAERYTRLWNDNAPSVEEADCGVREWVWLLSCGSGGYVLREDRVKDKSSSPVGDSVLANVLSARTSYCKNRMRHT